MFTIIHHTMAFTPDGVYAIKLSEKLDDETSRKLERVRDLGFYTEEAAYFAAYTALCADQTLDRDNLMKILPILFRILKCNNAGWS